MTRRIFWIIGWIVIGLLILSVALFLFNTPTSVNGVTGIIR